MKSHSWHPACSTIFSRIDRSDRHKELITMEQTGTMSNYSELHEPSKHFCRECQGASGAGQELHSTRYGLVCAPCLMSHVRRPGPRPTMKGAVANYERIIE